MVLVEAAKPTLGGLAIGLAGALLLAPVLKTLVFGVTTFDPTTRAAVMIVMLGVAILDGLGRIEPSGLIPRDRTLVLPSEYLEVVIAREDWK